MTTRCESCGDMRPARELVRIDDRRVCADCQDRARRHEARRPVRACPICCCLVGADHAHGVTHAQGGAK